MLVATRITSWSVTGIGFGGQDNRIECHAFRFRVNPALHLFLPTPIGSITVCAPVWSHAPAEYPLNKDFLWLNFSRMPFFQICLLCTHFPGPNKSGN